MHSKARLLGVTGIDGVFRFVEAEGRSAGGAAPEFVFFAFVALSLSSLLFSARTRVLRYLRVDCLLVDTPILAVSD